MTYAESRRITGAWITVMLRKTAEYEARLAADATHRATASPRAAHQGEPAPDAA